MKLVNTFDLWAENWEHAKRFFNSKGNTDTKTKLKARWYNDFMKMLEELK